MAVLVGIQATDGSWENFVLPHDTMKIEGKTDLVGRIVPPFRYVEMWSGIPKDSALRLANELKGIPQNRRREAFLQQTAGLKKIAQGGTLE